MYTTGMLQLKKELVQFALLQHVNDFNFSERFRKNLRIFTRITLKFNVKIAVKLMVFT